MEIDTSSCMFCHDGLDTRRPENLAFLAHLDATPSCKVEFQVWTDNMQRDFLGD